MILKSIYFNLNRDDYPNNYGYSLMLLSRHFCNYLEREVLKKTKTKTENFGRWVINLKRHPTKEIWVNSEKVLVQELAFDKEKFESTKLNNVSEYFIETFIEALERVPIEFKLPKVELIDGINRFKNSNFKNSWIHKKKLSKDRVFQTILNCELTPKNFALDIEILKNKKSIFSKQLLKLDPDPVAYNYRFKDIIYNENKVIISSKISENLFEFNLD